MVRCLDGVKHMLSAVVNCCESEINKQPRGLGNPKSLARETVCREKNRINRSSTRAITTIQSFIFHRPRRIRIMTEKKSQNARGRSPSPPPHSLEKPNSFDQRLRQIIHAALDRPIETGRNNESMQVLRTTKF